MTAHTRKKLLLPIRVDIDLVPAEVSVEELASVTEVFNQGGGSNQGEEVLAAETQVPGPTVSIATYNPNPEMSTLNIP